MKYDLVGNAYCTEEELAMLLYSNPELDISLFTLERAQRYNEAVEVTYSKFPLAQQYEYLLGFDHDSIEKFHEEKQNNWLMPDSYKQMDIAQWVLDQCHGDVELQRAAEELLLYQNLELFDMLRFCKYFVDTMRANNVVWGLGRGSSVASFVLFLIGVHKINSIYYGLDIEEFLKTKDAAK